MKKILSSNFFSRIQIFLLGWTTMWKMNGDFLFTFLHVVRSYALHISKKLCKKKLEYQGSGMWWTVEMEAGTLETPMKTIGFFAREENHSAGDIIIKNKNCLICLHCKSFA